MSDAGRIWQLAGTFLPLYGILLTLLAAVLLKRAARAAALVVVPLATFWLCYAFGEQIAYDGNMLFVALALAYSVLLWVYYPVLLVIGVLWLVRRRRQPAAPR